MYNPEVKFYKDLYNTFFPEIEKETELNEEDYNNLYIIKHEQKNENRHYLSIDNNTPDNNLSSDIEKLQESYIGPEDNNKLSQKQLKVQLNENNSNLFISKKTTKSKADQIKFTTIEYEETISTKKRKKHDKYCIDKIITKVKSFIFKILILFLNHFSENLFKAKKDCLRQICCSQATNGTVDFNKELMKSQLKFILSDTGDDYNKRILNDLSKYQVIKTFLELKLEDIFIYLRNKISEKITETNKIFRITRIQDKKSFDFLDELNLYFFYQKELNQRDNDDKKIEDSFKELNLYYFYQKELNQRDNDDKKIIQNSIKEDFVKLINERKSKIKK